MGLFFFFQRHINTVPYTVYMGSCRGES
uniref:Uncharacterized protein n=1 Tax=Anguilla anguilla TaxID=7936 RepID=A0A0E9PJD5_ANGAN